MHGQGPVHQESFSRKHETDLIHEDGMSYNPRTYGCRDSQRFHIKTQQVGTCSIACAPCPGRHWRTVEHMTLQIPIIVIKRTEQSMPGGLQSSDCCIRAFSQTYIMQADQTWDRAYHQHYRPLEYHYAGADMLASGCGCNN